MYHTTVTYPKNKIPSRIRMAIIITAIIYLGNRWEETPVAVKSAGEAPLPLPPPSSTLPLLQQHSVPWHSPFELSIDAVTLVIGFSCVMFEGVAVGGDWEIPEYAVVVRLRLNYNEVWKLPGIKEAGTWAMWCTSWVGFLANHELVSAQKDHSYDCRST
jgi:hypothetical protein